MRTRNLGNSGLQVSALGLGCIGMSEFYGTSDEGASLATLERALELGVTFWDTADMYGSGANEELLSQVLRHRRQNVTLATKFGLVRGPNGSFEGINGRPAYVKEACDRSLARLGVEHIDLYYQHRVDPAVPIEDTVGAMADLVRAGKVRYLGLSEASAATLRRAVAVHPIAALQTEYSLWTRDVEEEILPTCRALGIGLVAYSPLGRGFLTGRYTSPDDFEATDFRRFSPRFGPDNLRRNLALVDRMRDMAGARGVTPAQLALAWLLCQSDDIVPIPGTRKAGRLEENCGAVAMDLSKAEADALASALPAVAGERYDESSLAMVNG